MHTRRKLLAIALAGALAPLSGRGQSQPRRVAVVALASIAEQPLLSLVEGLRELGYAEGRNLELFAPASRAQFDAVPRIATAAVARGAEVVVAYGSTATAAAKKATGSVPIVMVVGVDPVAMGFVSNLARPEGNVTGLATSTQVLILKRLELMKEIVPSARRLAVLWNSSSSGQRASLGQLRSAAATVGVEVLAIDLHGRDGLAGVAELVAKGHPDALIPLQGTTIRDLGPQIVRLAAAQRLPAVYTDAEVVRQGGLLAYSPDARAELRRAAHYVDRILKGARPADLPVEQATKFQLALNLTTAKALGLAIPAGVMVRADEVVE